MLRSPNEITHNGVRLSDALQAHRLWLRNGPDGERLVWDHASLDHALLDHMLLDGASLRGTSLNHASLRGTSLNHALLRDATLDGTSLNHASLNHASLNHASLNHASLNHALLNHASLRDASLNHASLWGVRGNMREVKSAHFDKWPVAWVTDPDGEVMVQIGCQQHPLSVWEKSDPRWISTLDSEATDWWAKYREVVLMLVKTSPATPYGKGTEK